MAKIGSLVVDMRADTASFTRDMKKAERNINSTSANMNKAMSRAERSFGKMKLSVGRLARSFSPLGLAAAGAAGVGGLGLLIKRSISAADSIATVADKVGLTTTELQELRFAAERVNVTQETLDMAMQRFSRRLGEAVQGQGELRGTLDKYNIAVTDSSGRTRRNADVLADLADAIQNAGSEQERLRISFKAFDSEGAALVNLLAQGSSGLNKFREDAQRLGVVIDDDLIRNSQRANEQMKILEKVIGAQLTNAAIQAAPQIGELARQFAEAIPSIVEATQSFLEFIGLIEEAPTATNIKLIEDRIESMRTKLQYLQDDGIPDVFQADAIAQAREQMAQLTAELERVRSKVQEVKDAGPVNPISTNVSGALPSLSGMGTSSTSSKGKSNDTTARANRDHLPTMQTDQIEKANRRLEDMVRLAESVRLPVEVYTDRIHELNAAYEAGFISQDQYAEAVQRAQDRLDATGRTTEEVRDITVDWGERAVDVFKRMADGTFTWRDALSMVAEKLLDVASNMDSLDFSKLSGGGGGGGGGSGIMGSIFSGITSMFTGFGGGGGINHAVSGTGQLGAAFADGGRHSGGIRLVGEEGPEIEATGASRIFTASQTQKMLGGGGGDVHVNIDARGAEQGVEQKVRAVLRAEEPRLQKQFLSASESLAGQGGRYAKSMGRR